MATPTGSTSGTPYFEPRKEEDEKTIEGDEKSLKSVSKIVRVTGKETGKVIPVTAPIPPIAGKVPMTPSVEQVTTSVKKPTLLELLLKAPLVLQASAIESLPDHDLEALEIAISKGTGFGEEHKKAINNLHTQISRILNERILKRLFVDHPSWEITVQTWNAVSLPNKIWLLRIFELHQLDIQIPQIDFYDQSEKALDKFTNRIPALLKQKGEIEEALAEVKLVEWNDKNLQKCPESICLLRNLECLNLSNNRLTEPPDVGRNLKLNSILLPDNKLKHPPDTSQNPELRTLLLDRNELIEVPNVHRNRKLKRLSLSDNQLGVAPDISHNRELRYLNLSNTALNNPPDLSHNPKLRTVKLSGNYMNQPPDVTKNGVLYELTLNNNHLWVPPNSSQNPELGILNLSSNMITNLPDISNNKQLNNLDITDNPLLQDALDQIGFLQDQHPGMDLVCDLIN